MHVTNYGHKCKVATKLGGCKWQVLLIFMIHENCFVLATSSSTENGVKGRYPYKRGGKMNIKYEELHEKETS